MGDTPITGAPVAAGPAASAPAAATGTTPAPATVGDSGTPGAVVKPELNADGTPKTPGAEPTEAEKRIKQLVAQRKEEEEKRVRAEQEAAYWRGLADGKTTPAGQPAAAAAATPPEDTPPVEPDPTKFERYEDFDKAKAKYLIEQAKYEFRRDAKAAEDKRKQDEQKAKEKEGREKAESNWRTKVEAGRTKYEDFIRVISNPAFTQTDTVAFLVKDSEVAEDLVYYLGTHLDEANRLNGLPPHLVAKEIGKIEARITTKSAPVASVSAAPAPITPVTTTGPTTVVDEQDPNLSMEEFAKRRNMKEYGKRAA